MMNSDYEKVLNIFIKHYKELDLIDLVTKIGYTPPIRISRFKELLGITDNDKFIKEFNRLCEKGLLRVVDVWVYPGHKLAPQFKKMKKLE